MRGLLTLAISLAGLAPAIALAQDSSNSSVPAHEVTWRAAGGYDWFALRDIARTGPPVDASPVAWRGRGATVLLQHIRARSTRVHRFELLVSGAGGFAYDTRNLSTPATASDRAWRTEGRYEYRRYMLDDLGADGLDVGLGVQAIGARSSIKRVVPVAIESRESITSMAPAVVVAARVRRWSGVRLEAAWINGMALARLGERHSADAAASRTRWGGGWLTDVVVSADVTVARRLALSVTYARIDDGLFSSHRSWTTDRRWLTFGVTYAK
jgi:hypothetical protein